MLTVIIVIAAVPANIYCILVMEFTVPSVFHPWKK